MPFQLPSNPEKTLSPNTIKIYQANLNKVAKAGFDTREKVMESPAKVVKAIDTILGESPSGASHITGEKEKTCTCPRCEYRRKRRLMLSSIFYTLPQSFLDKPNALFKDFKKNIQNA
jgi:hypothetical protein